jgi:DNA-directed RNA polymerase II subunit RPB2
MQYIQSSSDSINKTFPIVANSAIRVGEKVSLKIPRRAKPCASEAGVASEAGQASQASDNEATKMIKTEIEKQQAFSKLEEETRARIVESIINEHRQYDTEDSTEHISELRAKIQKEIDAITTTDGKHVLDHLGGYEEDPFTIIESYFADQHLARLVRHQIESYNHFINYQAGRTIQMFNPLRIHSDKHLLESGNHLLEIEISFDNFKMYPPQIHENNGATKIMLPQEAKLRNFTYASNMTVDVHIKYIIRDGEDQNVPRIIEKTLPKKINIGKMPIMLKSSICVLTQNSHIPPEHTGECPFDCGGYFIIKGSEKTVLGQERAAENRIYCFDGKNTTKWNWFAEIKSVPDYKCISPKQLDMMIASKNNGFGHGIYVTIPRFKLPIELFALYRALGVLSDREICEYILLDIEDSKQAEMLACLEASIIDGNKYPTQEDSLRHIVSMAAFTPINMDKDSGAKKKREFALDVLGTDLLPHCRTLKQKLYLIGTMAKKLIQTSLGWLPPDDRDSYVNKRIELTGTLLNNLFRNYFNKLVKEMQKKIVSEINSGSWRTSNDYENIITMNNIYKIMKTTTIENGISRALSTGDFSIKQSNSSKVGVGQVANRLTYLGTLSHLRRINTPLEKSGELIEPRKLHGTTWGFLCPAETPEGQSIGVVKNISYMAHITIPTNSVSLYEYVEPCIVKVDDVASPTELYDKVKVFVNGIWLGVTDDPVGLYADMKDKKHRGIINIYTSIVFNYKTMEIRICNDGGRLTRPVLRVKNDKALLTSDVVRRLGNRELAWNDLLTNCRIAESVIEYIDPEEQNHSMIAMKSKNAYLQDHATKIQYTHCEIHPSTIFGVLASCIPFPEHNQAPRNTYQCAMGKQAIGIYCTNYDQRMDKTAYVLTYPSRPLVDTRLMNFIHLNKIPSGTQIYVAIMTHTGYNQEDSVLINKGSIDRGLFMATIYHTEKDEDNNVVRDEIKRCKPNPAKTKGIKFGNYEKLNAQGFMPENALVENRDVIIAKVVPIKENRNDPTKTVKFEDQSKTYRTTEESYIDKNYTGRNGDGYDFAKVRVRTLRKPVLGDKFCALPTQQVLTDKGWVTMLELDPAIHRVCTLNTEGKLHYEFPSAKFEFDHNSVDGEDEPLYHIKNKQVEITCTMNHKLYVQKRSSAKVPPPYKLVEARKIAQELDADGNVIKKGTPVRFQKTMDNAYPDIETIRIGEVDYNMDAWLQLLGMFISDGCCDKYSALVAALKERKVLFVKMILDTLNVHYTIHADGSFCISRSKTPAIYEHFKELSVGALNKYLPEYVWNLSQRQSRVLLEALLQGDGHTMKYKGEDEFSRYGTISLRLANDVSRLALHCGWSGIVKIAEEPTGVARIGVRTLGNRAGETMTATLQNTYYKVSIIREQNQPWINKKDNESNTETRIPYNGKVYCIEMPSSHVYYMRESTNSPSLIIGNSSRHGQKGTCGNIIPERDMPYTRDGLKPDIIINPHAIPSRMTIAQLKETLLGKVLVELGIFGDGTSFGNLEIKTIAQELQKWGYESYGNEIMYNGVTGEQMETSVFIGPVFYQRLKHMVNDKQHSRAIGPMVNLTRQPAEGRSRDGGFRVGEMERDVMIAHGASNFCKERLYDASDKYSAHVCRKCGLLAAVNAGAGGAYGGVIGKKDGMSEFTIHRCNTCDNTTEFARVDIPYAYKLLSQELQTINVVPRLVVD